MVSCKLYGRLGNQMFQLATAIATAIKWNVPFHMPDRTVNEEVWPNYFKNIIPAGGFQMLNWVEYKEPSHAYTEIPRMGINVVLDGYFQSHMYFYNCMDAIRSAFGFNNLWTNEGLVSIHVRRGDYLNHPTKHPVITIEYIRKAIEVFSNQDVDFLIFSDDIQWCKENLNVDFFSSLDLKDRFEYAEVMDPLVDMTYMAMSEHNIIANSSYSVMAALMNNNPNKKVVCPDEGSYFGIENKHLDVSTLMPPDWHRIKF